MTTNGDAKSRLREARRRVRDQTRLREAMKLERSATVLESGVINPTPFDFITAYSTILDRFRSEPWSYSISNPYDRKWGRNFPIYQSEPELSLLRAPSRVLCQTNCYAMALVGGLKSYIIGGGNTYRAKEREKVDCPQGLVEAIQEVVDRFLRRNQWNASDPWQLLDELPLRPIEGEAFERSLRDGEACLLHYADPDSGETDVRWVESEFITQPTGKRWEEWSFGVQTPPDDEQKKLAFWITFTGQVNDGDEYPIRDISFLARNSDRIAKRGVPDFSFDAYHALQTAQRLRSALATGGAQKAAIVGVRQHKAQTQAQTQAFSDALADMQQVNLVTGRLENKRFFSEGEWEDLDENLEYVDGPSTKSEAALVEVLNACLRGAVVRWNGFEWLVSADASSNSYANALAAESPAVRRVLSEQEGVYKPFFARSIAIAVRNACDAGRVRVEGYTFSWEEVRRFVEVQIEAQSPEVRNKAEEAQANSVRVEMGWKSPQTVAAEEGLDWEQELQNIKEFNEIKTQMQTDQMKAQQAAMPGMGGPGMGGEPGQEGAGGPGGGEGGGGPGASPFGSGLSAGAQASGGLTLEAADTWRSSSEADELSGDTSARPAVESALWESWLTEGGFSGIDAHGRKWLNGQQQTAESLSLDPEEADLWLLESLLLEAGFTGQHTVMVKGKPQTWYYRDGHRVPGPHVDPATQHKTRQITGDELQGMAGLLLKGHKVRDIKLSREQGKELLKHLAPAIIKNQAGKLDPKVRQYLLANFGKVELQSKAGTHGTVTDLLGKKPPQETGNVPGQERQPGGKPDAGPPSEAGRPVEEPPGGTGDKTADRGGTPGDKPAGEGIAGRVPASQAEVNRRLNRYEQLFRESGQQQQADWMRMLRDHVNTVGTDEALKGLGATVSGKGEDVVYGGGWEDMGQFAESYLNRHGITPSFQVEGEPSKQVRFLSALADDETRKRLGGEDFVPSQPSKGFSKLDEAKHLPGLETSEDLGKVVGGKVTHLTPEVLSKLDEKYGKGQWIVKSYGEEAFAGFGIYFPQRAAQLQHDAQSTIWASGENLRRYGFEHLRDQSGKVVGVKHQGGDEYLFGTKKYRDVIQGDARHWADKAAEASKNENGAELPELSKAEVEKRGINYEGGKWMVQPAFPVLGISDEQRAQGVTGAGGGAGEGRVHILTRGGKAEIIPHSTWIKGEWLPVVFEDEHTKAMAQAAVDAINALPESERQGQIYAPDIVRSAKGPRVIEANPANPSGSGYLGDNPFIIDSYVSHLTGREPGHVQFIRKLLTSRKKAGAHAGAAP